MGKSVNPFSVIQSDYKWMMKVFKYCRKCGLPCISDTIIGWEPSYDTRTGKQYLAKYWGCPNGDYIANNFNSHTSYVVDGPRDA